KNADEETQDEKSDGEDPDKQNNECKSENANTGSETETNACKSENADPTDENCRQNNSVALETYNTLKNSYDELLMKYQKLEEYKNNRESQDMKNAVELALNSVSHILDADQIDTWRKESVNYSYAQFNDFSNKLKAFAF